MDNSDKLIQDKFNSLPPEIKEALARIPWKERVAGIAKREGLNEEAAKTLETETLLVLYGFMESDTYADNIMSEVGLEAEIADRIAQEVSDEIFADIEKQYELIEATLSATAPKVVQVRTPNPAPATPTQITSPSPASTQVPTTPNPTGVTSPASTSMTPSSSILPSSSPKNTSLEVSPNSLPSIKTAPTDMAPVQTPSVPAVPQAPKSIVEEKLTQVTVTSAPAAKQPTPSYTTGQDPYREPVE